MTENVKVETVTQRSPLLGRQMVHDERSRGFAMPVKVDRSSWHDKAVRVYDPIPNPYQQVGCCTGVAKMVQFNATGNRKTGEVLGMATALQVYSQSTKIDPFEGTWPPTDTGSSGLASCKAAQDAGLGGEYRWLFGGADEVVENVMAGRVISVGTWWYESMFDLQPGNRLEVSGEKAGGHQWAVRGYDVSSDMVMGRCWWGSFRDFWIARSALADLLADDGDAHWQARV